jgi:hypothetical protein
MANTDLDSIVQRLDRIEQILVRYQPGIIVDPAPDDTVRHRPDIFQTGLLELIRRWGGGTTDPAPEDLANVRLIDVIRQGVHIPHIHQPGDPGPDDIARLSRQEVEAQIHQVNAEKVRLQSLEKLLNERLGQVK